jgi:hypothetical protein
VAGSGSRPKPLGSPSPRHAPTPWRADPHGCLAAALDILVWCGLRSYMIVASQRSDRTAADAGMRQADENGVNLDGRPEARRRQALNRRQSIPYFFTW